MEFKELKEFIKKHLSKAAVTAGVAAAVVLPSSCNKGSAAQNEQNTDKQGLLDDTPLQATDEYDNAVTLTQANVQEYDENGEPTGCFVLTRGIDRSGYESSQKPEDMDIKPAYLNDSPEPFYVKVDEKGAILTDRGFCGLFRDYGGHVHIVAGGANSKSVKRFIEEQNKARADAINRANAEKQAYASSRKARTVRSAVKTDSTTVESSAEDSVVVDTTAVRSDTLSGKQQTVDKPGENVVLDTLLKQREQERNY